MLYNSSIIEVIFPWIIRDQRLFQQYFCYIVAVSSEGKHIKLLKVTQNLI